MARRFGRPSLAEELPVWRVTVQHANGHLSWPLIAAPDRETAARRVLGVGYGPIIRVVSVVAYLNEVP